MRLKYLIAGLSLVLGVAVECAWADEDAPPPAAKHEFSYGMAAKPPADASGPEAPPGDPYVIGPGDVLALSVWKDRALGRQMTVLPDGAVSLPLLGRIAAAGKTVHQIEQEVTARIRRFLPDPVLDVSVLQTGSMVVYIIGRVNGPGRFAVQDRVTVLRPWPWPGGWRNSPSETRSRSSAGRPSRQGYLPFATTMSSKTRGWHRMLSFSAGMWSSFPDRNAPPATAGAGSAGPSKGGRFGSTGRRFGAGALPLLGESPDYETVDLERTQNESGPVGHARLDYSGEHTTAGLTFSHDIQPAGGQGPLVERTGVGLSVSHRLSDKWRGRVFGNYYFNINDGVPELPPVGDKAAFKVHREHTVLKTRLDRSPPDHRPDRRGKPDLGGGAGL